MTDQLVFDPEVIQQGFVLVLGGEAGVGEVAVDVAPFVETAVVEELELFGDDEGDDVRREAFFQHHQSADAAIAVLEGVDALELAVEVDDVFEGFLCFAVVGI